MRRLAASCYLAGLLLVTALSLALTATAATDSGGPTTSTTTEPANGEYSRTKFDYDLQGYNIASQALGGKIANYTSQFNDSTWAAARLIDGFDLLLDGALQAECLYTCGWRAALDAKWPQDIVFSFYKRRQAVLQAVILHPKTKINASDNTDSIPARIEIWTSRSNRSTGWRKAATSLLHASSTAQLIELPPDTRARFVKLRILSTHGNEPASLGEVQIIEDPAHSILKGLPRDIAQVENGGALVWFTSQSSPYYAANTVWRGTNKNSPQWRAGPGPYGPPQRLPQELVYAFNQDRVAWVERVGFDVSEQVLAEIRNNPQTSLAKTVSVEISQVSPLTGFTEVARMDLATRSGPQFISVGKKARFLKLRVLSVHTEGLGASLGSAHIFEGDNAATPSVLLRHRSTLDLNHPLPPKQSSANAEVIWEVEPNDRPDTANDLPFDKWSGGTVHTNGDEDFYRIKVIAPSPVMLNLDLRGVPALRSSLTLSRDHQAQPLYQSAEDLTNLPAAEVSLQVPPGDLLVSLGRPPDTFMLVWDTSGSMKDSTDLLEKAVLGFIDRAGHRERQGLIRFSEHVAPLTDGFAEDVKAVKDAAIGQFEAQGGTTLYRAIAVALDKLEKETGNRAVVLVTDGQNSSTQMTHEALWQRLTGATVPVFAIGLGPTLHHYNVQFGSDGWRFLQHVALATNGGVFQAATAHDLSAVYKAIEDAVRSPSQYHIKPSLGSELGLLEVRSRDPLLAMASAGEFEIILDASGSMASRAGMPKGERRIDVAKQVLGELIDSLPADAEVGLRAFGHRIREYEPGDCRDSELLHPITRIDRDTMHNRLGSVQALGGTTPLAYSLVQAAKDLLPRSNRRLMIVITDGEEYCGADPTQVAQTLQEMGFPVQIEVVGFALDQAVERSMRSLAAAGAGHYHRAVDASTLHDALRGALGLTFQLHDAAGNLIANGGINRGPLSLPEGRYLLTVKEKQRFLSKTDVVITAGHLTRIDLQNQGNNARFSIESPLPATPSDWDRQRLQTSLSDANHSISAEQRQTISAALTQLEKEVLDAVVNRPRR